MIRVVAGLALVAFAGVLAWIVSWRMHAPAVADESSSEESRSFGELRFAGIGPDVMRPERLLHVAAAEERPFEIRVVGSDGLPLVGVAVAAWPAARSAHERWIIRNGYGAAPRGRTRTRDVGGASLSLEQGTYELAVEEPPAEAELIQATDEGAVVVHFPMRALRLRIVDASGRPVVGARVHVRWQVPFAGDRSDTVTSGAGGEARLFVRAAEDGPARLRVTSPDGLWWNTTTAFVPPPADAPYVVVLEPRPTTASLGVEVVCSNVRAPIAHVVTLREIETGARIFEADGGDALGGDVHAGLPPGRYRLHVGQPSHGASFGVWESRGHAQEVELVAFETTRVRIEMTCGGLARARVTGDGLGMADVSLRFRSAKEEERRFTSDGEFEIARYFELPLNRERVLPGSLEPGSKVVHVRAEGYRERLVPVEIRAGEVATLRVDLERE